ncbi:MAG: sodium:proton exchanger [Crocinitomicaceae bacterium]|nr:sodium:proton exchanger [Crocinitomicaceae bacterium]
MELSSYTFVIVASAIVILSYFYNIISKKTNIPSVLLLIITGFGIKQAITYMGAEELDLFPILEVLGIVGLIMIVLEAALDLELKREKAPILYKALLIAFLGLVASAGIIGYIIQFFLDVEFGIALLYALPLSIISSAIVIPSITALGEHKKEFMIYESTFSDILGIMFFYFLISGLEAEHTSELIWEISWNIVATVVISLLVSYMLVYIFQNIRTKIKLFLLIAVLILLYAIGKQLHLSSLLIILVFGLILNNQKVFFKGVLDRWLKPEAIKSILTDFQLVTVETAFIVRTFFFVIFGATITIESLFNVEVFIISTLILAGIYISRVIIIKAVERKDIDPQIYIAPRGLITILLFFNIPSNLQIPEFDSGILLYVILSTSLIMTWSLIKGGSKKGMYDDMLFDDEVAGSSAEVDATEKSSKSGSEGENPSSAQATRPYP